VAVESRLALENGINTIIEGNMGIQKRLERMERLFEACVNGPPARPILGDAGAHSYAISVRSAGSMTLQARPALVLPEPQGGPSAMPSSVTEALRSTQITGPIPMIQLEFEETLAESGVYRRIQGPSGTFSIYSGDDRSITKTIMTTYSLADNASVLSCYPIIDRVDLRHPEFYAAIQNEQPRDSRFLSAIVPRRRRSSDARGSPQMSVPRKKVRTPPNCGSNVMGFWSCFTRQIWRTTEFRFETLFEVPVIFVCNPRNTREPIKNKPVYFLDGSQSSLVETRIMLPDDYEELFVHPPPNSRFHEAHDKRATWVTLLSHIQSMEHESRTWYYEHYSSGSPTRFAYVNDRTLTVAVQRKTRSWDKMPANIKKPFATTAFCHLLEIAAMMGIHWKEFDRSRERYQGEGNGYMLTGSHIPDLGLMFTFQIYGKDRFWENRVIPVDEVKELCCGFVSTLFRESKLPEEKHDSLEFLQLGSIVDIAKTMLSIGCNTDTANYFRSNTGEYNHLFPVPFELLGMLGRTIHIRNSGFRMLPNPTPYHWHRNFFDLPQLVREYRKKLSDPDLDLPTVPQLQQLQKDASILVQALKLDTESTTPGFSMALLNTLHDVLDRCDSFLRDSDRVLFWAVVREHFQVVLKLINEEGQTNVKKDDESDVEERAMHFGELTAASPEMRQEVFMELYFHKVFGSVTVRAVQSYQRRQATRYAPLVVEHEPSIASIPSAPLTPPGSSSRHDFPSSLRLGDDQNSLLATVLDMQPLDHASQPGWELGMDEANGLDSCASSIWCTLVLRMMCWLLLHDFDRRDVQLPKSELLGSLIPVYIA
jgi:hypothetical protein